MGRVHARRTALYAMVRGLDGQPLAAVGTAGHLRPLHHEVLLPLCVEPQREDVPPEQGLQDRLRMGQRHYLRHGRRHAGPYLPLPDVCHPHLVDGTVAAGGRLSLCEQGGLRTPDAQHAAVVPVRTPHDAVLADQEIVLRGDQVAVPPSERTQADPPQRRGGLQLPGGGHRAARGPGRDLLRRRARVRTFVRQGGGAQASQSGIHDHQPPRGQARELHQALHRHPGRLARGA